MPPQSILPRNSWFADSSLEQTGFEPLVPLKNGQAPRADRDGLSACPANSKTTVGLLVRIRFPPGKSQANFPTALTRPNRSHLRAQGIHLRPRPKSAAVSDFVDPELGNVPHIRTPVKIDGSVRVRLSITV